MNTKNTRTTMFGLSIAGLCLVGLGLAALPSEAKDPPAKQDASASESTESKAPAEGQALPEKKEEPKWAPAVDPKPLTDNVKLALSWLVETQQASGGWSSGDNVHQGNKPAKAANPAPGEKANVADTCTAALALIRSGSTPAKGQYARNITKAVNFICGEIENSETDSLFVTNMKGTRLQSKLGTYVDTFLAAMILAEVKDKMSDDVGNTRVDEAIARVTHKMEKNQQQDGSWGGSGWATALQQGLAAKAYNRVAQSGAKVDEDVRRRVEENARKRFDKQQGKVSADGSAGVDLYASSAQIASVQESWNSNKTKEKEIRDQAKNGKDEATRDKAKKELVRFEQTENDLEDAQTALIKKLDDKKFIAGFGSNGGEEFLSYLNIGESLVVKGDDAWKSWDKSISQNMTRIQNKDGSWSGHHCITGRTFCTSSALLVLMVDRAPVPLAAKIKR